MYGLSHRLIRTAFLTPIYPLPRRLQVPVIDPLVKPHEQPTGRQDRILQQLGDLRKVNVVAELRSFISCVNH